MASALPPPSHKPVGPPEAYNLPEAHEKKGGEEKKSTKGPLKPTVTSATAAQAFEKAQQTALDSVKKTTPKSKSEAQSKTTNDSIINRESDAEIMREGTQSTRARRMDVMTPTSIKEELEKIELALEESLDEDELITLCEQFKALSKEYSHNIKADQLLSTKVEKIAGKLLDEVSGGLLNPINDQTITVFLGGVKSVLPLFKQGDALVEILKSLAKDTAENNGIVKHFDAIDHFDSGKNNIIKILFPGEKQIFQEWQNGKLDDKSLLDQLTVKRMGFLAYTDLVKVDDQELYRTILALDPKFVSSNTDVIDLKEHVRNKIIDNDKNLKTLNGYIKQFQNTNFNPTTFTEILNKFEKFFPNVDKNHLLYNELKQDVITAINRNQYVFQMKDTIRNSYVTQLTKVVNK